MAHDNEYHDNMVTMLELIWGKGYMAPGGAGNVAKLLHGTTPQGKRILDIGCGLGGPAFEMARTHGARVTGIDLEAPGPRVGPFDEGIQIVRSMLDNDRTDFDGDFYTIAVSEDTQDKVCEGIGFKNAVANSR